MQRDKLMPLFHPYVDNFRSEARGLRRQVAFYRYVMDEKLKELDFAILGRDQAMIDDVCSQLKYLEKVYSTIRAALPPEPFTVGGVQ